MLYPLRFAPVYMEKVWGGRRLETLLGRRLPADTVIGESWEISDHPHGPSVIVNGVLQGTSLHAAVQVQPEAVLGTRVLARFGAAFPLLVKYIDAQDKLSVQVHPGDAYAKEHEGEPGKTEMWYVLHADHGASLIAGLRAGVTSAAFRRGLEAGNPADLLHRMPVKSGDTVFIPAGRIHALMPGIVVLEIQQNSDTTYRLYDWGRPGLDGAPRPLHVEQAIAVANWADYAPRPQEELAILEGANRRSLLVSCAYFTVEKYTLAGERVFATGGDSFHILNCVAGAGALNWAGGTELLHYGDSLLLPAALTDFALRPDREAAFLLTHVP